MMIENTEIEKYAEMSHNNCKKHFKNSINARRWKNTLDFAASFISATVSLVMPLLALSGSDSMTIAIVGNCFVFSNVIIAALQKTYGFVTLEFIHGHLSTEFSQIESEFRNCQRRNSTGEYNDVEKLIIKFQGICARSNIQGVKDCNLCCCHN